MYSYEGKHWLSWQTKQNQSNWRKARGVDGKSDTVHAKFLSYSPAKAIGHKIHVYCTHQSLQVMEK